VIEAINVGSLASLVNSDWRTIFPASNVPIATAPSTGDSLAIIGANTSESDNAVLAIDTGVCMGPPCCSGSISFTGCTSSWSPTNPPALSWYFDLSEQHPAGGAAAGQFAILNDRNGNPCLVAFTDFTRGTWFLSAPGEPQGGCGDGG